ncbi:hypothetical protein ACLOJK_032438 [Asimina triloba]
MELTFLSESPYSKAPSSAPLVGNVPGVNQIPYSPPDPDGLGHSRSWFTYDELSEATDCFSEHNLLGEGGFGSVYKGCLPDGREVAVKQLKVGSGQGEREFRAEVEIISRVHHRHLVSLVGYCISDHQRLLVYEYVPNNTLHYHLHGQGRPVLDWATRRKVAAGAARGIAYLHEDCNYSLSYLAPEYASSGKLTEKSDVFSFGVVLLEFITGRKPVDASQPLGDESLVEWVLTVICQKFAVFQKYIDYRLTSYYVDQARPLLCHALDNGDFEGLVDPRLEKNYVENEMLRMIEAAAACVRHSAAKRPRMSQVVRALDGISDSGNLSNGLTPGQSELFVSAQSAEIRSFHRMAFGDQDFGTDAGGCAAMEDLNLIAADCVVICCCGPCLVIQILVFLLLKLPSKLARKMKKLMRRRRIRRWKLREITQAAESCPPVCFEVEIGCVGHLDPSSCHAHGIRAVGAGVAAAAAADDDDDDKLPFRSLELGHKCAIMEAEKMFEELFEMGEFAFGSFWCRQEQMQMWPSPVGHLIMMK